MSRVCRHEASTTHLKVVCTHSAIVQEEMPTDLDISSSDISKTLAMPVIRNYNECTVN